MTSLWRSVSAALAAASIALPSAGAVPARAQAVCTTVSVVSVRRQVAGITPTILDVWAFAFPPASAPSTVVTTTRVLVCPPAVVAPEVIVAPPAFGVFSGAADPPAPPAPPAPRPAAPAPPPGRPAVAPRDTVSELAQHPARFDRQVVSVTGTAAAYRDRRNDEGAQYAAFDLRRGAASVLVVAWGRPTLPADGQVRVTGTFHAAAPFALAPGDRARPVLEAELVTPSGAGR